MATVTGTVIKCMALIGLMVIFVIFSLNAFFIKNKGGQI